MMLDTKPPVGAPTPAGERAVLLPGWAINMTRRMMQLCAERDVVDVKLVKIDGVRYLINERNELERMG